MSGSAIVQTAMRYLGYPYTATGNSPSTGFSCIGFVSFVYRSNGIALPGDLAGAMAFAPSVPFSDLMPGDVLYFQNTVWQGLSHAAIYIGGGKFIHAEWYNRGVVISSFNNDPVDGNYWIGHYLGANRPWSGAAVSSVVPTPPGNKAPTKPSTPGSTTTTTVPPNAPSTVVTVPSLNVRSSPSMKGSVQEVVTQGETLYILGYSHGWYKVQLPDGTVGWVIAAGIARSTPNAEIGTVKAPTQGKAATVNRARATVSASVSGLRVHSSPSLNAPVVTTVTRGQHMVVLSRVTGWVKVRLSDGTVGWISSSYVHGKKHVSHTSRVSQTVSGTRTNVAVNVRSGPSLHNSIVTVIPPGGTYQVLGWSNGWAHVRLPNGTVGWVSGTVLGSTGTTYNSYTYSRSKRTTSHRSTSHHAYSGARLTAGVRVHSRPGIKAPVVTLAASGTHITILGYRGSWALVRLPSGTTGYVLGMYVRA